MRIYPQKNGSLSEPERLEIARLLVKAGYNCPDCQGKAYK